MASRLAQDLRFGPDRASSMPKLIYGTAWKEEQTSDLVYTAMKAGFRGIDTAGGSGHYREDLVRRGFHQASSDGLVQQDEIYVQSKFNPRALADGRDHREVVRSLVTESLKLRTTVPRQYLDAYVLHVPLRTFEDTLKVWESMSAYVPDQIRHLGISNVSLPLLRRLYDKASVKPAIVQNSFSARTHYDVQLRKFCRDKGIAYQSFWTITANQHLLESEPVSTVVRGAGVSSVVACYSLVLGLEGISVLDGTTNEGHMREDLQGIDKVGNWAEGEGARDWDVTLEAFKSHIGETRL
ncbi:NAD(P)H-dependent D-xylose reductase [Escovopsis weberi]|uniref:NAD(P)H-dependent D-xylose reductase n=1 Tax=Escovopsis weberi TaxID=150374 RepID=A0A0M8NA81_ESCWE|nr:NAD(P)H-dependent D-xylose reductase [Escovopsis weberi]